MCGIAGTVYNKDYHQGIEVKTSDLFVLLRSFKQGNSTAEQLLEAGWKYKSNINFIRYCKDSEERNQIKEFCEELKRLCNLKQEQIPNIDKSLTYELYNQAVLDHQNMLDVLWFLSVDIKRWLEGVRDLSNRDANTLSDEIIIFYKDLIKVINAIDNRLELRGRDSFGISIVINSNQFTGKEDSSHPFDTENESCHYYQHKKHGSYNFIFKTCNSIGALGENAAHVKNMIAKNSFFKSLIESYVIESSTIMAHTRWASVGKVTLENAHPINYISEPKNKNSLKTISMLNGDIYNYREIIEFAKKDKKLSIDDSQCTTDCLAIPVSFLDEEALTNQSVAKISSSYTGSFVISIQHSSETEKIFISKKGIQGLYLGFSYDGYMFASDVYGLVESCRHFLPIESESSFEISSSNISTSQDPEISILDQSIGENIKLSREDLRVTNITTRDIDKKDYDHFLNKEIHETSEIVSRTISNYLQPKEIISLDNLHESIVMNDNQVPPFIMSSLRDKKIKKIIITGMGTCYTAAVAISMFMRARLRRFMPFILVEPHVATEGSAFYLQPNMQDTLVIVIAQSGTTVDTNVYVQMAKERGAMSLAIANKREGDVTFIVDGTIYIGDGRDIEIAVPSTKTYTAQVILGYILTLFFATNLAKDSKKKDELINDLNNLRNVESIIQESFRILGESSLFDLIGSMGCQHNSWYIVRDNSTNAVCADEIRIKYSENCYQSVSSLSLMEINSSHVKNSFIVIMTESKLENLSDNLLRLLNDNNSIIVISIGSELPKSFDKYLLSGRIINLNMLSTNEYFTFIPTIIAGQLLSYYQAMILDRRRKYFDDIKDAILNENELKLAWFRFLDALKENIFSQGFSITDINFLNSTLKDYVDQGVSKKNSNYLRLLSHLNKMIQISRRTIDTIKHQAKTITVGAVRENTQQSFNKVSQIKQKSEYKVDNKINLKLLDKIYESFESVLTPLEKTECSEFGETLVAYEGIDESYAYNIVNFVNGISNQLNSDKKIRLARSYDYPKAKHENGAYWIVLTDNSIDRDKSFVNNLDSNQYIIFNFEEWEPNQTLREDFLSVKVGNSYKKAIWSLFVGICLSNKWLMSNILRLKKSDFYLERTNFEIASQLKNLSNAILETADSNKTKDSIRYSMKVFLSRTNWKSIGSGVNYNLSKYVSKRLIKEIGRSCAFDVLENHKHIDISAESSILIFLSNIWKSGYQEDAFSEIEKLIAHNNIPIIITNDSDDRFDNFYLDPDQKYKINAKLHVPIIKLPKVGESYSFSLNIFIIEKMIEEISDLKKLKDSDISYIVATNPPDKETIVEDIW